MNRHPHHRRLEPESLRQGYTLPEILVTVTIIAVLGLITFLVVGKVRRSAHSAVTLQHTRSVLQAMFMHAGDHNNTLPPLLNNSSSTFPALPEAGNWWWHTLISKYLTGNGEYDGWGQLWATSLRCPAAPKYEVGSPMSGPALTFAVNFTGWNSGPPGNSGPSLRVFAQNNQGGSAKLSSLDPKTMLLGLGTLAINNPYFTPLPSQNTPVDLASGLNFSWLGGNSIVGKADGSAASITWKEWQTNADGIWGASPR